MPAGPGPGEDPRLEVTVVDAHLIRIFDSIKATQDLFVQLDRRDAGGHEKMVARSDTCLQGNLLPKWGEKFIFSRGGGVALKLKVFVEHQWRNNVLCGEVELELDALWEQVSRGQLRGDRPSDLPLHKKGDQTGVLRVAFSAAKPLALQQLDMLPSPREFQSKLRHLLDRPEELEERVRERFRQLAKPQGRDGRQAMRHEEMTPIAELLAGKLGVPTDVFGEINQMFWRFEVTGEALLYEAEAVRLIVCMLRQYRDAICPPRGGPTQLGTGIKTMQVSEQYKIVKELGRGGQGIAYLASARGAHREVVLKMYAKTNQKQAVEDITQEFELLMTLKHPKIAHCFDIFQDWDNVYIVQEPYFGGDLTTAVTKAYEAGANVDERWLARTMVQVLQGVEFLHNNGVVHSDLKEANVMVASSKDWDTPQVIVIDFGLSNKFSSKSGVGGTPGYMPPEVWDHGLWTPRGDVFSLGVMLYTLRVGNGPFTVGGEGKAADLHEIARQTRKYDPPIRLGSASFQKLVRSMLSKGFLERPMASRALQDSWFQSDERGQELDMKALGLLAKQRRRTDLYRALLADVASHQNLAQLRELNDLFIALDVNNDGHLSAQEVRQALEGTWRAADVERLISSLGMNEGGDVSYDQFMGELLAAKAPEENALLQQIFNEADSRGRGYLTLVEVTVLANRPNVQQVLGDLSPEALMRAMDLDRDGRVTIEEFKRALQGERRHAQGARRMRYRRGQTASFWSKSHCTWITCTVVAVDEAHGAVQVDCKPDYWIAGEELEKVLRPHRAEAEYRVGQAIELYSTTYSTWIPCTVTNVDEATGAVQVDQKPNYWFQGNELHTRLKPAGPKPPQAHAASAAKAGVGKQLFNGALVHLGAS